LIVGGPECRPITGTRPAWPVIEGAIEFSFDPKPEATAFRNRLTRHRLRLRGKQPV